MSASVGVINALTDINFQSLVAGEGVTYEFVQKQLPKEDDQSFTLKLAFKRVSRVRWGTNGLAPNFITYKYPEMPEETQTRIWFGIDKQDRAVVMAALMPRGAAVTGTPYTVPTTCYVEGVLIAALYMVQTIEIQDNDDGSNTYSQVLDKSWRG